MLILQFNLANWKRVTTTTSVTKSYGSEKINFKILETELRTWELSSGAQLFTFFILSAGVCQALRIYGPFLRSTYFPPYVITSLQSHWKCWKSIQSYEFTNERLSTFRTFISYSHSHIYGRIDKSKWKSKNLWPNIFYINR